MIESLKKYLLEIDIFCKIVNVFTVTFDPFNVSLVNKSINLFKEMWPQNFSVLNILSSSFVLNKYRSNVFKYIVNVYKTLV